MTPEDEITTEEVFAPPSLQERDWRYGRVEKALADAEMDALIAYGPGWRREDVRYLTAAPVCGDATMVALSPGGPASAFSTHDADTLRFLAAGWVDDSQRMELEAGAAFITSLRTVLEGAARVGIAHLELMPMALFDFLRSALPGVELVSASRLMEGVRLVKSEWEIAQVRRADEACAAGWRTFVDVLEPGLPEYRILAAVEEEIKRHGAEDNFMPIASGGVEVTGMTPPGDRLLELGDMVRTELTPQVNGYWTQICRVAVVGPPSDEQRRSFDIFNEALDAGVSTIKPGITAHDIAKAENDVLRRHGFGEYCTSKHTRVRGHGLGVHFDEFAIVEGNEVEVPEGAVCVVHPNTYTPIAGYHVLGDPVVVTGDGHEIITSVDRALSHTDHGGRR